ncbi:MAG: 5-(carboxyamino)imidazole ribonucleotide synthase [Rickettsiales bacterium]|jgi:5-(carboxyamino)imidazole ribonucleotide synthase|nr:5-(carboxyamino)imidazole ribonucleotide synthase [Rickettsiales bacterium]
MTNIKTIGIVGGGQLGLMMVPAIHKFGFRAAVLDPSPICPCTGIADIHIVNGFDNPAGFAALAAASDVITYEFEHISVPLLAELEKRGAKIFPSVASLKIIQDKLWQKTFLEKSGILIPEFRAVNTISEIRAYWDEWQKPFMIKCRRGGYDGKGIWKISNREDIDAIPIKKDALMIESLVDFDKEISVIATRAQNGECVIYPVAENIHKNSILDINFAPADIDPCIHSAAKYTAEKVMECFAGVGTFCTEMFVSKTGQVLVNEVAPRVHNSGHWTIEGAETSQFENHIRAVAGLPLGATKMTAGKAVMKNIIGEENGRADYDGLADANSAGWSVHIYGKPDVKVGRKMGHITKTGAMDEPLEQMARMLNVRAMAR